MLVLYSPPGQITTEAVQHGTERASVTVFVKQKPLTRFSKSPGKVVIQKKLEDKNIQGVLRVYKEIQTVQITASSKISVLFDQVI